MKGFWRYLLFGLTAYLIFLLITFPAQRAYVLVRPYLEQLPATADIHGIEGYLFSGYAQSVVIDGKPVGSLNWELSPWSLAKGQLATAWLLQLQDGFLQGGASMDMDGAVTLYDLDGRVPAALVHKYTPLFPITLDGQLSLNLGEVKITGGIPEISGVAVWHQAMVNLPQQLKLGDLKMDLIPGENGGTVINVNDSGGPLQAEGKLSLDNNRRYRVRLQLAARDRKDKNLNQALTMLGTPDTNGKVNINLSGQL